MKEMPNKIKQLLRQYKSCIDKAKSIQNRLEIEFEKYGVPFDNLSGERHGDEPFTEVLTCLSNGETEDIEQDIEEVEEVFLYFVNKKNHS